MKILGDLDPVAEQPNPWGWHVSLTVGYEDRPGIPSSILESLHREFDTLLAEGFSRHGSPTAEFQLILDPKSRIMDPLHRSAELQKILSVPGVEYVSLGGAQGRKDSSTPTIFVAYDFRSPGLAKAIDELLGAVVTVTGHCGVENESWREYVAARIQEADGVLGVVADRPLGPSANVMWEWRMAQYFDVPGRWLVSSSVDPSFCSDVPHCSVFSDDSPKPAIEQALADLLKEIRS